MKRAITTFSIAAALVGSAAITPAPAQAAPSRTITKAEVARHSTAGDCWVILGRSVYDMTAYIPRHPGGPDEIVPLCGGRATAAFSNEHAGDRNARRGMASLKIGQLKR
jgi:cytochrome b involved in lipid metabolism